MCPLYFKNYDFCKYDKFGAISWKCDISFLLNRFSVNNRFPFPLFLPENHLVLLKDRFVKKMLLKRAKNRRFFFPRDYRLI